MAISKYREYRVWQKAFELSLAIYKVTGSFPKHEVFGITSQMRRAATSIVANIAEGAGRKADGDFARFLTIARGSANELETFLLITQKLGYVPENQAEKLLQNCAQVLKMLTAFHRKLKANR